MFIWMEQCSSLIDFFHCVFSLSPSLSPSPVFLDFIESLPVVTSPLCLPLKAYLVQEERDRLRLEYIELEERVNSFSSLLSVGFWKPWIHHLLLTASLANPGSLTSLCAHQMSCLTLFCLSDHAPRLTLSRHATLSDRGIPVTTVTRNTQDLCAVIASWREPCVRKVSCTVTFIMNQMVAPRLWTNEWMNVCFVVNLCVDSFGFV